MFLGQKVKLKDISIAPNLKDLVGIIAKIKTIDKGNGKEIDVYRVYFVGHPLVEWVEADSIEPIEV